MSRTPTPPPQSDAAASDLLLDARRVEARHQQLYQVQLDLAERIEQLLAGWSTPESATLYRAYESFDGDIEHIKESLDLMHGRLVAAHRARTHTPAGAEQ
ncbi:MAG TPA: hypothetical protein VFN73_12615 [Propionibacteriaceae bacterium]|nr:hypothetical protein [Propionibacteriaceae bacterium]